MHLLPWHMNIIVDQDPDPFVGVLDLNPSTFIKMRIQIKGDVGDMG